MVADGETSIDPDDNLVRPGEASAKGSIDGDPLATPASGCALAVSNPVARRFFRALPTVTPKVTIVEPNSALPVLRFDHLWPISKKHR
jgi:hypothetical protein